MKALRTYSMLATFGLAMIISGQLIWNLCPAMDIINVTAWSIFIAVAASMIFVVVTEPKPKRRADWKVNKVGISMLVQKNRKHRAS